MTGWTERLIGHLNTRKVWSRDPVDFLAFRLRCDGTDLTWAIAENVMTTSPVGGTASPLTIDLTQYTISTLAAFLAEQTGYDVLYPNQQSSAGIGVFAIGASGIGQELIDSTVAGLGAIALRDQTGDVNTSNGDHLYVATNLIYQIFGAISVALRGAKAAIVQMLLQMQIPTASGEWLDFHGKYYAVPRNPGEVDGAYGPRIIPQVLLPKGNNVALANAISAAFGQPVQVVDVLDATNPQPHRNGLVRYDGTIFHANTGSSPVYGLFDVTVGQDILGAGDPLPTAALRAFVENLRDAGTQLRSVSGAPSQVADTAPSPSAENVAVTVTRSVRHNGTYSRNGSVTYSGSLVATDAWQ